jgi:hypothetical protein
MSINILSSTNTTIINEENINQRALYLNEISNLILQPFLSNNGNEVVDLQSITCCLDLIPVAINILFNLRKQFSFLLKWDITIIDSFFDSENMISTSSSSTSSLLNILSEAFPRLRNRHLMMIKKHIVGLLPNLQRNCEEYPGVMRICLRFFEQSSDCQWIHIFRLLYASVPIGELQHVEAILEQILSQTARIDQAIIDIFEDTAFIFCKRIIKKQISSDETIPLISLADVRLLLMTMRISDNNSTLHLNLKLPSIVFGIYNIIIIHT